MPQGDRPTTGGQGLYRLKPASQRLVEPLADGLARRRISPDAISAAAVVAAALGGACLAGSTGIPALLLVVPFLAAARLILNLLDGMVARRTGTSRPMGEVWNEVGDRLGDVLFIGALAFVPAVGPALALGAALAAVLASFVGLAARAAGGRRLYGGILSKPGRMIVLAVAAPLAFLTGDPRILAAGAVILLVGGVVTLLQRLRTAARELGRAG
jgi:CDP-diacylglycerol--glycerol-3-phosphate 3-phosphatidyltransferase